MRPEPISVTDLNKYIKTKVAEDEFLNNVFVKGEISNFKHHYTGHMYFTLKDENSLIKCVMFKTSTATLNFMPENGMKVLIFGTVSVFERDGIYQIYCKAMQKDGIGDLYKKYEELKLKLEKQGYFDEGHKLKIPYMPKVIGVLTSQTGSVIKDIINVATRRNPNVYIRLFSIPVQGDGAKEKICEAIKIMNEQKLADVIILARGGGSLEDLWPFNEEIVAEVIYESRIPIISAIGHETDFTIADFVADCRAPTPSAAAEIAVQEAGEIKSKLETYNKRYKVALRKKLEYMTLRYQKAISSRVFKEPMQKINEQYINIDIKIKELEKQITHKIENSKLYAQKAISKLDALSPLKTLTRGYCIATVDNNVIRSSNDINIDDTVNLTFSDGKRQLKVTK